MATNITITLSDEQVAAAAADGRYLYPSLTDPEIKDILEDSAIYGPGIHATIREWRATRVRQEENDNRKTEEDAYELLFPPNPNPIDTGGGA